MPAKPRILVVDDDDNIRTYLKTLLEKSRFEVKEADSGTEAIKHVKAWGPQVVLLDKELPDMDGFEVCKKLTSNGIPFDGKVIILSGHKKTSDQVSGLCCGAVDYLAKPVNPELLVAKVTVVLRELADKDKGPQDNSTSISKGVFTLCTETHALSIHCEKTKELTPTEYKIVKHLLEKSPRCTKRMELFLMICADNSHSLEVIDVHISNLRKKLGRSSSRLYTCRGEGMKLLTD